ncbi:hypothetical protein Dacet_0647 [Denitrovibrio acetiphilus DSM 12809]|uniref:Uncharacterized protein n=1 Tax=Denitrovibrio acetiphilus (strain DSM 12809 / NBRC 114555 / N2460) TaxID=522772 RepID=D4H4P1_DENA2|nr:hypothetical protein [Denitrovibrio acetiphilus]ADD67435.1 hypothetical protein Dacet_0647 [Denitrovibrio acetiphilus DSM 12809]
MAGSEIFFFPILFIAVFTVIFFIVISNAKEHHDVDRESTEKDKKEEDTAEYFHGRYTDPVRTYYPYNIYSDD